MQAVAVRQPTELEAQRLELLKSYNPHDHLATWTAFDKRSNRTQTVIYYPAAWRLYELSLRYPNANFSSDIIHMDAEKDFVIVRARLYLGNDYNLSEKRAEAHKQGRLTELDRVETKAKARAARDFGIGTEHALDMDDLENATIQQVNPVNSVNVVEAETPRLPAPKTVQNGHSVEQASAQNTAQTRQNGQQPVSKDARGSSDIESVKSRLNALYMKAQEAGQIEKGLGKQEGAAAFLKWASEVLGANVVNVGQLTTTRIETLEAFLSTKDAA